MKQLGANNPDVRPLIDELAWIGKLESFVLGRGGPDAPIRIYADEDRIGEILKHWEDDASSHQRSLDRIASYVPEFATPYAEALSHLRKLQSDDSVYLAAIERLKASIAKELSQDHAEALDGVLNDYADKYPRLGGLDRVREDLRQYLDLQKLARGASLGPLVAMLGNLKFTTPPFQEQFRQLSANRLPSPDVVSRYQSVQRGVAQRPERTGHRRLAEDAGGAVVRCDRGRTRAQESRGRAVRRCAEGARHQDIRRRAAVVL